MKQEEVLGRARFDLLAGVGEAVERVVERILHDLHGPAEGSG